MARNTFKYNPETLTFEKYKAPTWYRVFKVFGFLAIAMAFSVLNLVIYSYFFPTPREQALSKENEQLAISLKVANNKIKEQELVVNQLIAKDNDLYRVILQAEPNPESMWEGGIGGVNQYAQFEGMDNKDLLIEVNRNLRRVRVKLGSLSKSYEELATLATTKEERLAHIPAIQPVSNEEAQAIGIRLRF